jgi:hypothetical protein
MMQTAVDAGAIVIPRFKNGFNGKFQLFDRILREFFPEFAADDLLVVFYQGF